MASPRQNAVSMWRLNRFSVAVPDDIEFFPVSIFRIFYRKISLCSNLLYYLAPNLSQQVASL